MNVSSMMELLELAERLNDAAEVETFADLKATVAKTAAAILSAALRSPEVAGEGAEETITLPAAKYEAFVDALDKPEANRKLAALLQDGVPAHSGAENEVSNPNAPPPPQASPADERSLAELIANYYRRQIGILMRQAEHWAKEKFPLAVHHRVHKADAYYQIVCLCENENPFDAMREELGRPLAYPPGTYPPTAEIHAYRYPDHVVEKLKSAPREAGGTATALTVATARIEALEKALRPFACASQIFPPAHYANAVMLGHHRLTVGHLRAAHTVLGKGEA